MVDSVTFRTTDNTRWGTGKGSDLDADEIDINFWVLYGRLLALEASPPTAVSISNIDVVGSQMQVNMSDSTHFGPFTLPIAKLEFRGVYTPGMTLNSLDLVEVPNQGLYMVLITNTDSDDPFNGDATDGSGHPLFTRVFGADTLVYDVGFFYPGKPGIGIESDGYMLAHKFVREVTIPTGLTGSEGSLRVGPEFALSFPLYKSGASIGSVDFAISATTPTFTFTTDVDFAIGDEIQVGPPVSVDANARDLQLTLLFSRV